jgi:hypothetical protein
MSEGAVLITGARAPVAIDLARSFRAAGYDVHLADCVTPWAARGLRPRIPIHALPPPRSQFPAFRKAVNDLISKLKIALIVPTCEEVFWLAEAAARDGYADRLFAPPPALLRKLHSKAAFAQFAAELGLHAPETQVLDASVEPEALLRPLDEIVLKPEFSRFGTHTVIEPTAAQLSFIQPTPQHRWVAQQRIEGTEICSWAAVHMGKVAAYAAYRPRWRRSKAAAFQMEAVDIPAVRDVTNRVAEATGMTGHLSFDVIVTSSGQAFPIECNPRAVSGLHLFDADPALAQAIMGHQSGLVPATGTLRHMAPAMALLGFPDALGSARLHAFITDWRHGADVIDRERGGLVTLGCLADAARFAWQATRSGRSPAGATTADIEWNGEPIP